MRNTRKRVWKRFSYRECDAMKEYLEQMAEKGWYLKKLGAWMVFEQGIPGKLRYAVHVFVKGSEYDRKPEEDTEELIACCEAAGWKFVCNYGKFCVFCTNDDSAVELETDEEIRFSVIQKEESKKIWFYFLCFAFFFVITLRQIFLDSNLLFDNETVLEAGVLFLMFLNGSIDLFEGKRWAFKIKKHLQMGESVHYSRYPLWLRSIDHICFWICILYFIVQALWYDNAIGFIGFFTWFGITFIVISVINRLQPSRENHQLFVWSSIFWGPLLYVVLSFALQSVGTISKNEEGMPESFPLAISDLSDETVKEEVLYGEYHSGWFGSKLYCALGEEDDVYAALHYEVIESRFSWVLDHQWKKEYDESVYEETEEQIWGAERAVKRKTYGADMYLLRYPDCILVFQFDGEITPQVIENTREKLKIN